MSNRATQRSRRHDRGRHNTSPVAACATTTDNDCGAELVSRPERTLRPASLGKMFWVRGFLAGIVAWFAILFTIGIILFMPFWDKRNQNIWDKVSNCYVVYDANDRWSTKPDLR